MSSKNDVMDKEKAKQEVIKLIEKYNEIIQKKERDIKSKKEELTKQALIEPLFHHVLGWNIEDPNEVTKEEKTSKGWVDYSFRINGIPKFFLEAKSIEENLDDPRYFQQAVSYAFYKGCTWVVLTNFKVVKILNAEWKTPSYSVSSFLTISYDAFLERFDELWYLSKESFEQGLLDKLAEKYSKKIRESTIDQQLLNDFTRFRDILSKSISKLNQDRKLTEAELDESVQRILDRLIFIRNCEDRGLEEKKLWETRGDLRVWKKIRDTIFTFYDKNYDSKLFTYDQNDPKKHHLCDELNIDDSIIREIVESLYRTKDDSILYDFSIIPADTLGTVYEQYLGHILKKTEKTAKLTENHTHRKEQGIYYTPTYIVDYIVKNTLGELLKDEKVDVEKIRVLDPACGSGSFLIKAFDVLNEHYMKNDEDYAQTQLDSTGRFTRKAKILQNNIFGVDLDKQAIEIAQLNLLLKIAEKGHRLPLLEQNIKCGNSLIDDEKVAGDKAFKWEKEFGEIIEEGGFDVMVGNPPYVRPHNINKNDKEFFWKRFKTFKAKSDLYNVFMEKGINLLREGGMFSFIVPHTWISLESFYGIRKYILDNCRVTKLVQLPKKVFQDATVETTIFILTKERDGKKRDRNMVTVESLDEKGKISFVKEFMQSQIKNNHLCNFELYSEEVADELMHKIRKNSKKLGDFIIFLYGLKTGDDRKFIFDSQKNNEFMKLLRSKDVGRYSKDFKGNYVWYVPNMMTQNKKTARPGEKERFEAEKIIVARMGKKVVATFDDEKFYVKDAMLLLKKSEETDLKYLTGILNSKLINYCYRNYFITIDVLKNALLELPVILASKNTQKVISLRVEKMLFLNKQLNEIGDKRTDERARIEEEIKKTDAEIDEQVYMIYNITEDEKKTIEESLK